MLDALRLRQMQTTDLDAVMDIQAVCYTAQIQESAEALAAKLAVSPDSCFLALRGERALAYLIGLPARRGHPPALDSAVLELPRAADCLHLHDLAVAPTGRGSGAARALIEAFFVYQRARELAWASLVAVQNSSAFWQRHGFRPAPLAPALRDEFMTYGEGATYMQRPLYPAS